MRIRVAPQARADLDAMWNYVARESASLPTADRVIDAITQKFALFTEFPFAGKSLASGVRPNTRTFTAGNYVIFYSTRESEIRILRILHAKRDPWAIFASE